MYSKLNSWPCNGRLPKAVILAVFVMFTNQVVARPQPYGEHFLRLDDVPALTGAGADSAVGDPVDYREQMEALEGDSGPYADGLAEPLGSLGRYYRAQGEYEQALGAFRRALHIVRVNDGLYSDRQIPLLRELLGTFRDTGDFETLDQRYDYLFRLYGAGLPPHTEIRLRATLEYLRWQREALRLKLDKGEARRLLEAIELNDQILQSIQADGSVPYHWRRDFVFSQLRNLYILQDRFQPGLQEQGLVSSKEIYGGQPLTVDLEDQKMNHLVRTAQSKGRALVTELQQVAAEQGPVEEAALELAQADWYFWNGQQSRAKTAYSRVELLLREAGELLLLQEWLGQPVELPEEGAFWNGGQQAEASPAEVRASFDVSSRGRVSNVEAEALNPDAEGGLSKFKRQLSATLFRPRWHSGEAQSVEGLVRSYQLLR